MIYKLVFILLCIYILIRILRGPKNRNRSSLRFHFGNMSNRNGQRGTGRRQQLDEIEEAEFEDITDNIKKENKE